MSWLARLKKIEPCPHTEPTKPTKPENGGFVGFVGSPAGLIENSSAKNQAANYVHPALVQAPAIEAVDKPDWQELDQAYQAHHFACHTCQAAGRGMRYGSRCTVGLVLWTGYSQAIH